ncbi:hypothetical protein ACN6UB_19355 [Serratia marcescens]|uniref:hypothetical protein n=1 Tax=Serratia marcescens TaxID=615 RepID=UPI003AFA769B
MTLTTDELRQIAETDHVQCGDAAAMARELLANREAQPVYQYRMRNPYNGQVTDWETTKPEQVDFILKETIAANVEFRIIAAPPAPAVPEAISTRQAIIKMESHEPCDSINVAYKLGWNACRAAMLAQHVSHGYKFQDGWIACSEILPEPTLEPDGGSTSYLAWYKEKPDCGHPYAITNVHYLIKHWDKWYTHWMPLPAAPEGGNG